MATTIQPGGRVLVFIGVALLAVNAARIGIPRAQAVGQPVTPLPSGKAIVPYTVVLAETITGKTGNTKVGPSQTWALRSDGAFMYKIGEGELGSHTIVFADGTKVELNHTKRAKSTVTRPHDRSWLLDPSLNCTRVPHGGDAFTTPKTPLGIENIRGHRAVKVDNGQGAVTWYALDAGCATLQRVHTFAEGGVSRTDLVSLIVGEPSPGLFNVPPGYREGPQSELAGPAGECNAACLESRRRNFDRLDAKYRELRGGQ